MGTEKEEEDFLLAIVFLDMILKGRRINIEEIEKKKRKKKKTKGRLQVSTEIYRNNNSI